MSVSNRAVKALICEIYDQLMAHDGFGGFRVEIRILRRGQKEVIVDCGKQHRLVVDYRPPADDPRPGGEDAAAKVRIEGNASGENNAGF